MKRWKPWTVEIVGQESGKRYEVSFLRFWRREAAQQWCNEQNATREVDPLTRYEPARLP